MNALNTNMIAWARPPSSDKRLKMVEFNLFNTTILYHSANGATRETADTILRGATGGV